MQPVQNDWRAMGPISDRHRRFARDVIRCAHLTAADQGLRSSRSSSTADTEQARRPPIHRLLTLKQRGTPWDRPGQAAEVSPIITGLSRNPHVTDSSRT